MNLHFRYDKPSDVIYAFDGEPRPNYAEELSDGILILRDLKTRSVIGFMILNYSRQKADGYVKDIPFFPGVVIPY